MARVFADFESIHAEAYARLNEELGLDNFAAFMEDEEAKAKRKLKKWRNKINKIARTENIST
jgi:ribonucleoside-diphosphate reductase beta chain